MRLQECGEPSHTTDNHVKPFQTPSSQAALGVVGVVVAGGGGGFKDAP